MTHETNDMLAIVIEQADRLLEGEVTRERLIAFDRGEAQPALWRSVEDIGLHLALVDESRGGAGLSPQHGLRVLRRAGYHTAPVPLAETMLANWVWTAAGGAAIAGTAGIGPSHAGETLRLTRDGANWRLDGAAKSVPWAALTERAVLFARDASGDAYLVLLEANGTRTPRRNLAFEPHASLRFSATGIAASAVRPAPAWLHADGFLAIGALARAQQMVGAMEHCLDYAIAYAMERQQFGRPIAKFQAIQHMLAEAAGHYAASVAAADLALDAWGRDDFAFSVAIAKSRVGEATGKVAEICHQVHGAMGFTQEHPLHYCTRRLWSWRDEFGGESYWQTHIGEAVCAAGGEALWTRLVDNQD